MKAKSRLADVETAVKTIARDRAQERAILLRARLVSPATRTSACRLASGFRVIEQDWKALDRSSIGSLAAEDQHDHHAATSAAARARSGARLHARRRCSCKDRTTITLDDLDKMLARGDRRHPEARRRAARRQDAARCADPDPRHRARATPASRTSTRATVLKQATQVANDAIERTKPWVAKRGRQQFTGDRSKARPIRASSRSPTMMNDICTRVRRRDRAPKQDN